MNCKYEDKLIRRSNLDTNDSISTYEHWSAQQNPNAFKTFSDFICEIKPSRILEIGTSLGGFTSFLNYTCKKFEINCDILSYDIISHSWYDDMRKEGIDVRTENIFDHEYSRVKSDVIDFINKDGITLILCDGGNKIKEFNLLSNFMKIGDYIMAHDYSENKETFENLINKKFWNWFEISDSDIEDACTKNNLVSHNKQIFDEVVWVCKLKK